MPRKNGLPAPLPPFQHGLIPIPGVIRTFMVVSGDGYTTDANNDEVENLQVIWLGEAKDHHDAVKQAAEMYNMYDLNLEEMGNNEFDEPYKLPFDDISVYEVGKPTYMSISDVINP